MHLQHYVNSIMSVFHHKPFFFTNFSTLFMFQCNEHVEMNKFVYFRCTWIMWMTIIDSQFYIIDS